MGEGTLAFGYFILDKHLTPPPPCECDGDKIKIKTKYLNWITKNEILGKYFIIVKKFYSIKAKDIHENLIKRRQHSYVHTCIKASPPA